MSDAKSIKTIEREALEQMYLRSLKSRHRNMEIWDFVKSKCGEPSFFLQMDADGDPEEFVFEEMVKEKEAEHPNLTACPVCEGKGTVDWIDD